MSGAGLRSRRGGFVASLVLVLVFTGASLPFPALPDFETSPDPRSGIEASFPLDSPATPPRPSGERTGANRSFCAADACIRVVAGELPPDMGVALAEAARILGLEQVKLALLPDHELERLFPAHGALGAPPAAFSAPPLGLVVVRSSRAEDLPLLLHELGHLAAWGGPARLEAWAEEALVETVARMLAAYLRDPRCASPAPPPDCAFDPQGEPWPYDPFSSEEEWKMWMELDPARAYSLAFRWAEAQPWSQSLGQALEIIRRARTADAATLLALYGLPAHNR